MPRDVVTSSAPRPFSGADPRRSEDDHVMAGQEPSAAEANRLFYDAAQAAHYDAYEEILVDRRHQERLQSLLARTRELLPAEPLVLDACGGSGNAAVALLELGITPVVADISDEMTTLWRRKATRLGVEQPEIHVVDIETFLATDERRWDLVTLVSALHHLEDPGAVMRAVAARLAPGGVVLTIFDPVYATSLTRLLRKFDWRIATLLREPRHFAALLGERLRRVVSSRRAPAEDGGVAGLHVGRLAERHAYTGIDDVALVAGLASCGLEVVVHDRYVDARLRPVAWIETRLDRPSHFALVLRKRG